MQNSKFYKKSIIVSNNILLNSLLIKTQLQFANDKIEDINAIHTYPFSI